MCRSHGSSRKFLAFIFLLVSGFVGPDVVFAQKVEPEVSRKGPSKANALISTSLYDYAYYLSVSRVKRTPACSMPSQLIDYEFPCFSIVRSNVTLRCNRVDGLQRKSSKGNRASVTRICIRREGGNANKFVDCRIVKRINQYFTKTDVNRWVEITILGSNQLQSGIASLVPIFPFRSRRIDCSNAGINCIGRKSPQFFYYVSCRKNVAIAIDEEPCSHGNSRANLLPVVEAQAQDRNSRLCHSFNYSDSNTVPLADRCRNRDEKKKTDSNSHVLWITTSAACIGDVSPATYNTNPTRLQYPQ